MPREVGPWTQEKLHILELYLAGYLQATTKAMERIYIDAFAGPGTNVLEKTRRRIDGSPLLALKAKAANQTTFSHLYFIEKDLELVAELREALEAHGERHRWTIIPGDVNIELPNLVHTLPKRSPTFVFLDTEGIDPKWSTIEAVTDWRVEFFINFPLGMSIKRNLTSPKVAEYFGTEDALPILLSSRPGRTREVIEIYKAKFAEQGLIYSPQNDRLIRTDGNQQLYYLMLVSKVPEAEKIMTWVFEQPSLSGQQRLDLQ